MLSVGHGPLEQLTTDKILSGIVDGQQRRIAKCTRVAVRLGMEEAAARATMKLGGGGGGSGGML